MNNATRLIEISDRIQVSYLLIEEGLKLIDEGKENGFEITLKGINGVNSGVKDSIDIGLEEGKDVSDLRKSSDILDTLATTLEAAKSESPEKLISIIPELMKKALLVA